VKNNFSKYVDKLKPKDQKKVNYVLKAWHLDITETYKINATCISQAQAKLGHKKHKDRKLNKHESGLWNPLMLHTKHD